MKVWHDGNEDRNEQKLSTRVADNKREIVGNRASKYDKERVSNGDGGKWRGKKDAPSNNREIEK